MKRTNTELLRDVILRYLREEGLETPLNEHRPALRQDLMMGRTQLAHKLNAEVGAQVVQNIVFY